MKAFIICDNEQLLTGLRLAGIEGRCYSDREEAIKTLCNISERNEYALLLINKHLAESIRDEINTFRHLHSVPLLLEIPDEQSDISEENPVSTYIKNTIGVVI